MRTKKMFHWHSVCLLGYKNFTVCKMHDVIKLQNNNLLHLSLVYTAQLQDVFMGTFWHHLWNLTLHWAYCGVGEDDSGSWNIFINVGLK